MFEQGQIVVHLWRVKLTTHTISGPFSGAEIGLGRGRDLLRLAALRCLPPARLWVWGFGRNVQSVVSQGCGAWVTGAKTATCSGDREGDGMMSEGGGLTPHLARAAE